MPGFIHIFAVMAGNTIGSIFRLTTFGESHGKALGGIIDGCPSRLPWDEEFIRFQMQRRRPGLSPGASPRQEGDHVEFLSGIYQGMTTGAPIAFLIMNTDARPIDYAQAENLIRPGHAGHAWAQRYGIFDPRGGGRASARETAARVAAGAVANLFLRQHGIQIAAYVASLGPVNVENLQWYAPDSIEASPLRCPEPKTGEAMQKYLESVASEGDTCGGIVRCYLRHVPAGLGNPVFDKLQASLAYAMMSIPAAKGFEYGEGFAASRMKGSGHNDTPVLRDGRIAYVTSHAGGILGGISTGEDIVFNVAFKPVSSIQKPQPTVTLTGEPATWQPGGRHDVTVLPRAVPVVEAMAALVLADHILQFRKPDNNSLHPAFSSHE